MGTMIASREDFVSFDEELVISEELLPCSGLCCTSPAGFCLVVLDVRQISGVVDDSVLRVQVVSSDADNGLVNFRGNDCLDMVDMEVLGVSRCEAVADVEPGDNDREVDSSWRSLSCEDEGTAGTSMVPADNCMLSSTTWSSRRTSQKFLGW